MIGALMVVENEIDWQNLKKEITKNLDFNCSHYTDSFLKRRVECRLRATSINNYTDYTSFLLDSSDEQKSLKKELTIHVTHFFRDISLWSFLENSVIPKLIEQKNELGQKSIRIWSAGCSTGEEPYSISMLFHEVLGSNISKYDIRIHATDYDFATVSKARLGSYEKTQFTEINPDYVTKYFDVSGDSYKIKSHIKNLVDISQGDILSKDKPKNIDLIFCRNVVIYFDKEIKEELYVDFYDALNPQGFLVIGKTETLLGPAREKFKVFSVTERVFSK
jgi:chemotaxis protein methyltransferase CheR